MIGYITIGAVDNEQAFQLVSACFANEE